MELFVDERKMLEAKLGDSALEIASLRLKCELQCDYCDQNVENVIKLLEHKQTHHMKDMETQSWSFTTSPIQQFTDYKCFYCAKVIKTESLLEVHKNDCQDIFLSDFLCFDCGSKCTSKSDLDWHKTSVHEPFAPVKSETHLPITHSSVEREQCDFCEMSFNTLGELRSHMRCQHRDILPS